MASKTNREGLTWSEWCAAAGVDLTFAGTTEGQLAAFRAAWEAGEGSHGLARSAGQQEGGPMIAHTWHVLSNTEGTILAVYGSALLSEAEAKAHEVANQTGCKVALHSVTGNRPHVYGSVSMKGAIKWF
jgi:hypothetical protein